MAELCLSWRDLNEALWDAVARGLVTSDGFGALRSLMRRRLEEPAPATATFGLRRGGKRELTREGRWALLPEAAAARSNPDALAEAVAEQLLARWGVVFADVVARENLGVAVPRHQLGLAPFGGARRRARRSLRERLRRRQYAVPEAVDTLRARTATTAHWRSGHALGLRIR